MARSIIAILLSLLVTIPSAAGEHIEVCAKHKTNAGWSKGTRVPAIKATGIELNQATGTYNYEASATYVVITWENDQLTTIRLPIASLSAVPLEGEDRRGVKWRVSTTIDCR